MQYVYQKISFDILELNILILCIILLEIIFSRTKYALDLLKWFNIHSAKAINTPMSTFTKIDMDHCGENFDQKAYRNMIDSLLYLTTTRPNVMFSIGFCDRFQSNPKQSHYKAVKEVF